MNVSAKRRYHFPRSNGHGVARGARTVRTERVGESRIRCYDNGGKTLDRYTVVYMDFPEQQRGFFLSLGMSEDPTHPQGFGQHTTAMMGSHLGRRVPFQTLPERCRRVIEVDLGATHA